MTCTAASPLPPGWPWAFRRGPAGAGMVQPIQRHSLCAAPGRRRGHYRRSRGNDKGPLPCISAPAQLCRTFLRAEDADAVVRAHLCRILDKPQRPAGKPCPPPPCAPFTRAVHHAAVFAADVVQAPPMQAPPLRFGCAAQSERRGAHSRCHRVRRACVPHLLGGKKPIYLELCHYDDPLCCCRPSCRIFRPLHAAGNVQSLGRPQRRTHIIYLFLKKL